MLRQLYRLLIDLFSRARRQRRQAARARHERRERERRRYLHLLQVTNQRLLHDVAAQHREIVALKQQRKRECQAARRRLARPSRN